MKLMERQCLNIFADFTLKLSPHVSRASVLLAVILLPTFSLPALIGHSNVPGRGKKHQRIHFLEASTIQCFNTALLVREQIAEHGNSLGKF